MVTRTGVKQRKTRHKYKVHCREKGKVPLSRYFMEFKDGDWVNLKTNGNIQKGRFVPRFHGMSGLVCGKKGCCYKVQIRDGGQEKFLYVHPIHLQKLTK